MSEQCVQNIYRGDFARVSRCSRKAKRDGYCTQHHPDSVADREKKAEDFYQEERKKSPYYRLSVAMKRIETLKAENAQQAERIAKLEQLVRDMAHGRRTVKEGNTDG